MLEDWKAAPCCKNKIVLLNRALRYLPSWVMMSLWDTWPFGSLPPQPESAITISVKWSKSAKSAQCRGNSAKSEMQFSAQSILKAKVAPLFNGNKWVMDWLPNSVLCVGMPCRPVSLLTISQCSHYDFSSQIVSGAFPQVPVAERSDMELSTPVEASRNVAYPLLKRLQKKTINGEQKIKRWELFE